MQETVQKLLSHNDYKSGYFWDIWHEMQTQTQTQNQIQTKQTIIQNNVMRGQPNRA